MAWALQGNGSGTLPFTQWEAVTDFAVSGVFVYTNRTEIVIGDISGGNDFVACIAGGVVRLRVSGTSRDLTGFVEGDVVTFSAVRTATSVLFTANASNITFTATGTFRLDVFGAYNGGQFIFTSQWRGVYVLDNGADVRNYDIDSSDQSGSTNQPIITDTVGGNDATGVNFPAFDPSVWVNLGGVTPKPWWLFQEEYQ